MTLAAPRPGLLHALRLHLSAAAFGIAFLAAILATWAVWQPGWALHRYDFLLLVALAIQATMLAAGLEAWAEARVILVFHVVGMVMEIFKVAVGSWAYPEEGVMAIGGVPLFTGFMYAAVGSYIARLWRLGGVRLEHPPNRWLEGALAIAIYVNFFAHHYVVDVRAALFLATAALYWRTRAAFRQGEGWRVPILAILLLAALGVYVAENIGSITGTWLYPDQLHGWRPVAVAKLGSWFLLMILSLALVRAVHEIKQCE